VSFKIATIGCALLAMSAPAFAQDSAVHTPRPPHDFADDNGANLAVRTAYSPSPALSRQELFALLLLMSVPRDTARNSMQGGKP
jgi:hypothetical protein